jgi:ABC-type uncharacterized transport system substrate-binding protein
MSCGPRAGFHELDFVVNRKTAQALGLAISREFELRADEVIE